MTKLHKKIFKVKIPSHRGKNSYNYQTALDIFKRPNTLIKLPLKLHFIPSSSRAQLSSPRKSLRARLRLYQARGKDKISDSRRMSYLNAAVPISQTARQKRKQAVQCKVMCKFKICYFETLKFKTSQP